MDPNAREQLIRLITEKVLAALPADILSPHTASNQAPDQSASAVTPAPLSNSRATNADVRFSSQNIITEIDLVQLFQAGLTRIVIPSRARLTPLAQDFVRQKGIVLERTAASPSDDSTATTSRRVGVLMPHAKPWQKSALVTSIHGVGWYEYEIEATIPPANPIEAASNALLQAWHANQINTGLIIMENALAVAMAVNKFEGLRAVACWDLASARSSRQESQANVLLFDPRLIVWHFMRRIIQTWLSTPISNR
ncbi:RpiB/LacA/LacB family sugar-phosphate isomerase [candidate division KSB1 bacterium]|nr:RpiB/LacA/LacB family sugar-phosphate isomerase [candidate division KSB1 bacterium]